jgi:hypothetical protein
MRGRVHLTLMEIMHQPIAHLAFARLADRVANANPGAGVNTRTVAAGGSFGPSYESQDEQAGEDQSACL